MVRREMVACVAGLACLLPIHEASADVGPSVRGHVKAFLFERLVDPFEIDRVGAALQLRLSGGSGRPAGYHAAVDLRLDSRLREASAHSGRGDGFEIRPIEIFVDLLSGPLEVRLGQQFILWGRAAWMGPTDVLTAWDFGNMASEIEDYRLAPLGARVGWYPVGELQVDLVWLPVFRPNRLGVAPREMDGLPVSRPPPELPERSLLAGEIGIRISQTISSLALDWAVAGYRGYDKMPRFAVSPIVGEGGQPIAFEWFETFERLDLVGADLAKALGRFVLVGEAALKHGSRIDDGSVTSRRLEYVGGVDAVVSESLDLGLQYVGQHTFGRDTNDEVAEPRAGRDFVSQTTTHSVALRLRSNISANVGAQIIGVYSFTHIDAFVLAFAWWDVADALQARAGVVAFGGRDDGTPYAGQREHSSAFLELKYSF